MSSVFDKHPFAGYAAMGTSCALCGVLVTCPSSGVESGRRHATSSTVSVLGFVEVPHGSHVSGVSPNLVAGDQCPVTLPTAVLALEQALCLALNRFWLDVQSRLRAMRIPAPPLSLHRWLLRLQNKVRVPILCIHAVKSAPPSIIHLCGKGFAADDTGDGPFQVKLVVPRRMSWIPSFERWIRSALARHGKPLCCARVPGGPPL